MASMRETTRLEAAVGAAIVSQADFTKFGVGPDDPPDAPWSFGLTYDGTSNYRTLVSMNFPYEVETPFFETYRDGILRSNEYAWRIQSTNESLTIAGHSGIYRGSKNSQTNNAVFVVDMSGNPIRDFVVDVFPAMPFTKDSWAWIQGLVIMTIGVRIGFTIAVALNIALTTLMSKRQVCLSDVFPTIKRHIRLRSMFLVLAFVGDGFWSFQEWALSAGYNRYNLIPMFIVKDNIRSDFLTRGGIDPPRCDTLVVSLTSSAVDQDTSDYCLQGFLQNIVAYSTTGMNKWDRYELSPDDPPSWLVAREFVWFFAPCLGMTCALILYKVLLLLHAKCRGSHYRVNGEDVDNMSVSVKEISTMPGVPSVFLDNFIAGHDRLATDGLMAHNPPLFRFTTDAFQVPSTILWCSGWLILDSKFVMCLDDLPNVILRVLTGISFGHVYCCCIMNEGDRRILVPHLMTMPVFELTWRSLLHMSLDALWVKTLREGEQDIGNFSERTQTLKSTFSHRHMERRSIVKKTAKSNIHVVASIVGPKAK
ncbi:hypothetical protein AC1031_016389 [Aphanomyces cochlioides]|nr:hypothetical protein AC1031_016389 [Aphanomyces cochlioides]